MSWGLTWGDTWGSSWGYDAGGNPILVEENPGQYYGNGRRKPGLPADPWRDATDAEIEQLVRDKWEAIEAAQVTVKESLQVHDRFSDTRQTIEPGEAEPPVDVTETNFGNITAPSIIAQHWPIPAVEPMDSMALPMRLEQERRILEARQRADDEALLLILAEL